MEHDLTWPLYRRLPKEFTFFDVAEVIEFLQECPPEAPIWLVNYRQMRNITQRPMDGMGGGLGPDGVLFWERNDKREAVVRRLACPLTSRLAAYAFDCAPHYISPPWVSTGHVVGTIAVTLTPERQSTRAWSSGAIGEERVAVVVDAIAGQSIRVLHDRKIPRSKANIDHLVVKPSGVWVIDSKRYQGRRPELRVEGGILRPREDSRAVVAHSSLPTSRPRAAVSGGRCVSTTSRTVATSTPKYW